MCTLALMRYPGSSWPLAIAANRDEMQGRPWQAPARHWPDRPETVAGLDDSAGGSWLGMNDWGVVAGVLNRHGTLGTLDGKRSRGELVLEALDHADAADAAEALSHIAPEAYRPFNLVIADTHDAFLLTSLGKGRVTVEPIPPGLHMVTAFSLDDKRDPRIAANLKRFAALPQPSDDPAFLGTLEGLMGETTPAPDQGPESALCFQRGDGFGTRSSSIILLPSPDTEDRNPIWRFASGPPSETPYRTLNLLP